MFGRDAPLLSRCRSLARGEALPRNLGRLRTARRKLSTTSRNLTGRAHGSGASISPALECAPQRRRVDGVTRRRSMTAFPPLLAAGLVAALIGTLVSGSARAAEPSTSPQKVSRSGIPYLSDDQVGPPDLVTAIKSRRSGGKLLNLDRMLLHSPNFAKGWNGMFAAIRNRARHRGAFSDRGRCAQVAAALLSPQVIAGSPRCCARSCSVNGKIYKSRDERGQRFGGRHEARETDDRIWRLVCAAARRDCV